MDEHFELLFDESIQLEMNVGDLYLTFYNKFPEDSDFWWELVLEEKHHASLLKSGKEHFEPVNKFPYELLDNNLNELKEVNNNIQNLIKKTNNTPISREEAFNIALNIENSAGEVQFQEFMSKAANSVTVELFQDLNNEDKEHANRMLSYMNKNGIMVKKREFLC